MEIVFLKDDDSILEALFIPVVQDVEPISCDLKDEDFETINGETLNLIGGKGLRSFSFSSFFPNQLYHFVNVLKFRPPDYYIYYFEKHMKSREPLRIIIIERYHVVLNMLCRCKLSYSIRDRAGDVPYTLEVKEYILPKEEQENV